MKIVRLQPSSPEYPEPFRRLHQPPKKLAWLGATWSQLENRPMLAIVGSRKCSPYGRSVIHSFVRELKAHGVVIVSGLALGADSVAHQAALDYGLTTVAVLPSSIEQIYPTSHRQLARNILLAEGCLISEYSEGEPTLKYHFVARNRLIAALCHAVLLPEAAVNSGSLHTANFALELGKPVLSVPGPITSSLSTGTNNLIRQGATPASTIEDILEGLNLKPFDTNEAELFAGSTDQLNIMRLIQSGIQEGSTLQLSSRLNPAAYNQTMTLLELADKIKPLGADRWALK